VLAVVIIVPLILGIGLKSIMSKLWAMLNTFQLIHALSIIQVSVPSNVITTQKQSFAIINFQPIDKDLIYSLIFGEDEEFSVSEETTPTRRILQDEEDSSEYSAADLLSVKAPGGLSSEALENFDSTPTALIKYMLLLVLTIAVLVVLILLV
jgi:hypothetical protein